MRALLLYPEFPDTFWSFKHALSFVGKRASLPPLGLITVAALLPAEWELRLVDLNVRRLSDAELEWADIVFVSAMIAQHDSTRRLVARCRAAGKTVVAGGPLFTGEPVPGVGHLILGEAELTLPPFLADLARGEPHAAYRTTARADLRTSPPPRWDLLELRRYASMCIQYSRGCPFDCEFCDITARLGRAPRTKHAAQIVQELDALRQAGWEGQVFFVDDNLIGNQRRLKQELLPALQRWQRGHRGQPLSTEASINLADDDELIAAMVAAGFDQVFIGIETPNDSALAECDKRQNRGRDLVADVKRLQRAGLQVQGGFIVGFDSDTPASFPHQVEFIQRSGIVTAMVGLLNALPQTRLHARLAREGRLLTASSGDNTDGTMNFVPRMNARTLREGYRSVVRQLYAPAAFYLRIRTLLREVRPSRFAHRLDWSRLRAFALSAVRLGLLGPERWHYWRLLLWTLWVRPALLPLAVTLAIYGHHFRRCSEQLDVSPAGASNA